MPKTSFKLPPGFAFSAGGSIEFTSGDYGLTVESGVDKVCFMREFDITRDAKGLALAEVLSTLLEQTLSVLRADQAAGKLPAVLELIEPTFHKNPFG